MYVCLICLGAFAALTAAGSHRPGDEGRDHPAAPGPKLRPGGEHQQLSQLIRAEAHQCQVLWNSLSLSHTQSDTLTYCPEAAMNFSDMALTLNLNNLTEKSKTDSARWKAQMRPPLKVLFLNSLRCVR